MFTFLHTCLFKPGPLFINLRYTLVVLKKNYVNATQLKSSAIHSYIVIKHYYPLVDRDQNMGRVKLRFTTLKWLSERCRFGILSFSGFL